MNKIIIFVLLLSLFSENIFANTPVPDNGKVPHPVFSTWEVKELLPGGRFDAVAYLDNDVVIMGSRGKNPGHIFRSADLGKTWEKISGVTQDHITCLANGGKGRAYMLTGSSNFYASTDFGKTWTWMAKLSNNQNKEGYTLSYGLTVTDLGTILVADTESSGGHIYRSTNNGKTWTDLGAISSRALYRFERTGNGLLVNGWKGDVYRTQDDGVSWTKTMHLIDSPLYATEYLGGSVTLQASESGHIFRSGNYGETWVDLGKLTEAADDFVKLGTGAALLTTYREGKNMYVSLDYGNTWTNIGQVNPDIADDWFDHVIYIDKPDKVVIIGGTNRGFAVRAEVNRAQLYRMGDLEKNKKKFPVTDTVGLASMMKGYVVDFKDLNEPEDILVHRGYAYVPCRDGRNVAIVDLANPKKPEVIASIRHPDMLDMFGVSAEGNFLYAVSMSNQKLIIADISNVREPKVISTLTVGGRGNYNSNYDSYHTRLRKVLVQNGIAYVTHCNEGRLYIIDVKDPRRPQIISHLDTGDGGFAVFVEGDYAYLAGCSPGASVIVADIRNKRNPKIVKKISNEDILSCTCDFQKKGNYLFATGYGDNTFLTFDISDPVNITLVSTYTHPNMLGPGRLVLHGNDAFVINSTNDSMCSIDISNPKAPKLKYSVTNRLLDLTYGVAFDGKHLYLAGRFGKSFVVIEPK